MKRKILFLLPYPLNQAPSQRFRVEAYFPLLAEQQLSFDTNEFLDEAAWKILYKKGATLKKVWAIFGGYIKRLALVLFSVGRYEYIFIHREAAPLGPPIFEWWLAKVQRKKIIYDFDDAIWIPNVSESNRIVSFLKCFWKVKWICRWSHKISAGNDFLSHYASRFNTNVVLNPTCVDTVNKYNKIATQNNHPVTIGWTGSHSTIQFLAVGIPALKKLQTQAHFRFLTICNQRPEFGMDMEFKPWTKQTEIEDLCQINIGIMPLKEDAWSEGKCGFKLIQYMALGIPAVASPVGVNKQIINHGSNGYLCSTDQEWIDCLTDLVNNEQKRIEFGKTGREKILKEYSIASNASNFLSLFSN